MDTIEDWLISGGRKIGMYYLAITLITGLKVDVVMGAKVDLYSKKLTNSDLELGLSKIGLSTGTFRMQRADATMIG